MCVAGVWEIQSGESNQMVHMNVLVTCVFAAFLLGALIAGMVVYCYRDAFLRKPPQIHKDAESAQSRGGDPGGGFAKFNGLFDSPVKEYQQNMDAPKLYTNLLTNGKDPVTNGETKTMILSGQCQPPELAALPTPESTPVLQQKSLQPTIKNQWEKAHCKMNGPRRDSPPKSPQYFSSPASPPPPHSPTGHGHIPSAVVLPNATHDYRASFCNASEPPGRSDRKVQNAEQPVNPRSGRRDHRRSVDARNTLNDLLKHFNEGGGGGGGGGGNPKAIMADASRSRHQQQQHAMMLDPAAMSMTEIPPKVPSREASLYSPSSSLPRNSPTKRVDVPTTPTTPTGPMNTLERQRGYHRNSSQRHSISALPKSASSSGGTALSRQPSLNRGGYMPPAPPSRMDSHGVSMGVHPQPSVSRQGSYHGHGSLPRMGVKRTPSLKPDVPPKPNGFVPQTTQMRVVNKYSY